MNLELGYEAFSVSRNDYHLQLISALLLRFSMTFSSESKVYETMNE